MFGKDMNILGRKWNVLVYRFKPDEMNMLVGYLYSEENQSWILRD